MKTKTNIFLLLFLAIQVYAEVKITKLDSLQKVLTGKIHDTIRVKTLIELAQEHYLSSPALAQKDCEEAKDISEKIKYENGLVNAYGWLAYLFEQQGQIEKALAYNAKSLAIAEKQGSKKDQASILNNMAAIYKDQGRIDDALKFNNRALQLRKQLNDKQGVSTSYNNIGLIYSNQGRIPEALDYYSRSLKIEEELKNNEGIATSLLNIGFVYRDQHDYEKAFEYLRRCKNINQQAGDKYSTGYSLNGIGGLFEETGKPDSALNYYLQSLKLRKEIDDKQGVSYSLKNIGVVFTKLHQPDTAKKYFEESLKGFEEIGDKWGMAIVTNKLGNLFLNKGDESLASTYLLQSLKLAKELGYPADIRDAAGNLQQLYRRLDKWQDAITMNDLYITMRDSVINDNNRKASLRTQFKYEYEKKESKLKAEQEKRNALAKAELKKQKIIRNSITFGLVVVALFLLIVFRQRNKISKEKKRSDELLLNILPEETAEELKLTGTATTKSFDLVSVLFTDFKNFTLASEKLSPEELVSEINYCYSEFDKIVTKYGIEKIKTIGDAYMCAGGLPTKNNTHPIDVVKAGIEMQQFILSNKKEREAKSLPYFELRLGIHTGPVIAGVVGTKKFAYDIWGDTVNTASRMESSGEVGKVNISGKTHELIKNNFTCTYRGKIEAKNKGEIDMYFVEAIIIG